MVSENYWAFPDYANDLVAEALGVSGCPLIVVEEPPDVGYDMLVQVARNPAEPHVLSYAASARKHRVHFVVSAALKIKRVWECPPEERLAPWLRRDATLSQEDQIDLRRKLPDEAPKAYVQHMYRLFHRRCIEQLVNMPVDMRIEREAADLIPAHAPLQAAYLYEQVHTFDPANYPVTRRIAPPGMNAASTAMILALVEEGSRILGKALPAWCHTSPHRDLGYTLWGELDLIERSGHRGDCQLIDSWAELLGLRSDYRWRPLDQVPREQRNT